MALARARDRADIRIAEFCGDAARARQDKAALSISDQNASERVPMMRKASATFPRAEFSPYYHHVDFARFRRRARYRGTAVILAAATYRPYFLIYCYFHTCTLDFMLISRRIIYEGYIKIPPNRAFAFRQRRLLCRTCRLFDVFDFADNFTGL